MVLRRWLVLQAEAMIKKRVDCHLKGELIKTLNYQNVND